MTKNQLTFGFFALILAGFGLWIMRDISIKNAEIAAEINAQTEIERIKIEEEEATKRTKERMKWNPWYSEE
jgi:hypothetical protein